MSNAHGHTSEPITAMPVNLDEATDPRSPAGGLARSMETGQPPVRRTRSRRSKRRAGRSATGGPESTNPLSTRRIPVYEWLDEESLDRIEMQADWLLAEIGIEFRDDAEAVQLFRDAGVRVDGERVRFEPGQARELCSTAPPSFRMHARDPRHSIVFGGQHVVFMPAYGPPFVTDLDRGRRYATIEDFRTIVKLTSASRVLQHSGGTVCEPVDLPINHRHLDMVDAHLRYSSKPFMGAVTTPERAQDSIGMARLVFGDAFVDTHCVIQGNINVNSPLVYDGNMSGALRAYAQANQSVVISPFILGGAMGPVTQAALLAQSHAEAMAGIALSQLARPGAPVVYGNFLTTMDLRSGAPTFGTPEAQLASYATGQLCRRLDLPLRCGGHLTASKVADAQAMQESVASMLSGVLAGSNFVFHAAGWLESGLSFSYEKFAMDLDHCAMVQRMIAGAVVDEDTLAADAFREIGPGGNFLGSAHTLARCHDANYLSDLADNNAFERWVEEGRLDLEERSSRAWKKLLETYEAPPIDPGVDEALTAFIARRKAELPEQWH